MLVGSPAAISFWITQSTEVAFFISGALVSMKFGVLPEELQSQLRLQEDYPHFGLVFSAQL